MAKIIPDTTASAKVIQKRASIGRLRFGGLALQKLVDLLEVQAFAGRGMLDELPPAVSVPESSLPDPFEDVVFGFDGDDLDVAVREAMHKLLTACEC